MPTDVVDRVFEAWSLTEELHARQPPVAPAVFDEAQRQLGRPLPDALRRVYCEAGPGEYFSGLIFWDLLPAEEGELSVVTASDLLREWEHPIPDEMVVFGGDGADDTLGLWIPATGRARPYVIDLVPLFEPETMSIVGDSLDNFLRGWTAMYLLTEEEYDVQPALDALGVPDQLRDAQHDGLNFDAVLGWANPDLPLPNVNPFGHPIDAAHVRHLATTSV